MDFYTKINQSQNIDEGEERRRKEKGGGRRVGVGEVFCKEKRRRWRRRMRGRRMSTICKV